MNTKREKKQIIHRRSGLNREILLTLVLLLGAALLFGGFLFLRFAEQKFLDQHLSLLMEATRSTALTQLQNDAISPELSQLGRLQTDWGADAWWLYDQDLDPVQVFASTQVPEVSKARLRSLLLQREEMLESNWSPLPLLTGGQADTALVAIPLAVRGPARGLLVVHYSLDRLRADIGLARRWIFLYAFGYGLILAGAGFLLLRRNVVRPVKNLLTATEKVTGGELDTVLDEQGPAEIAQLAGSFNQMTRALQSSRSQTEATIGSLREANQALEKTRSELIRSEKLATVGHLAAGMAHEIGNPLGALTGYLALLQSELPAGQQREMARFAANEAERIDRLVRDLLDYSAPGSSDPVPFDPWQALLETLELLRLQGALKNMNLEFDPEMSLPAVAIDRGKLEQVLVNLLVNARDACGDSGTIRLLGEVSSEKVILQIEDNGSGMAREVQNQLFEPFFTTKAPGKGRGLGLAVCQRVIDEAGGEIQVRSEPGAGSCFSLVLPLVGEN